MLTKYDREGNVVKVMEEKDVLNMAKMNMIEFGSLADIENALKKYEGRIVHGYNAKTFSIAGVTIPAWSRFFFPFATLGESFGFAVYPSCTPAYLVCRVNNDRAVKQIV